MSHRDSSHIFRYLVVTRRRTTYTDNIRDKFNQTLLLYSGIVV